MTLLPLAAHLRWIARLGGTLFLLFFLVFVIAEGPPHPSRLTAAERLYGLGILGLFGGLLIAWFAPAWGGLLTLLSWLYLAVLAGRPPLDAPLAGPAFFGALHLACSWPLRHAGTHARMPAWVRWSLYGPLPLFLLLSANEIFGQPPLFAGGAANVTGHWSAAQVELHIAPDGSVTGHIEGAALTGAQLSPNRTAFGRLMRWRTDYAIRGTLSTGARFSLLADAAGPSLRGGYTLANGRWHPLTLVRQ